MYNDGTLVVRDAADGPFVAISHVWADGLGSATEVGLPTCQIARIATLTQELVPDGAFRIGSLCVPRDKELCKKATEIVGETYQRADKVLVLDAAIRQLSITIPFQELAVQLMLSPWMHRVWTLPEALYAQELYFVFTDGLVSVVHFKDLLASPREIVSSSALGPIPRAASWRGRSQW